MKYIILTLWFHSGISYAEPYIGLIIPPFPNEVVSLGGALIDHKPGKELEWAQNLVKINDSLYLWLNSFEVKKNKKAYFKVVHQVKLPTLKNNEYVYLTLCKDTKSDDKEITGVGYGKDNVEWHSNISSAWKSNLETGKIESISTKNIICYNEGYGV